MKLTILAAICAAMIAPSAIAQMNNCAPRPVVLDRLTRDFGEARRSIGVSANGSVLEMFAADETGTWTITVTTPTGMTCVVASGEAFEALVEAVPALGEDM